MYRTEKGAAVVEYILLVVSVVMIAGVAVFSTGHSITDTFETIAEAIKSPKSTGGNNGAGGGSGSGSGPDPEDSNNGPEEGIEGEQGLPEGFVAQTLNLWHDHPSYADPGAGDDLVDINFQNYTVHSETWYANEFTESVNLTVEGHPTARMVINGGSKVQSGTIEPFQSLTVYMQPSPEYSTSRDATVMAGSEPVAYFRITTRGEPDLTADQFDLVDKTGENPNGQYVVSNVIHISGIEVNQAPTATGVPQYSVPVTVTGPGNPEIRVGGGEWVSTALIENGQSLEIRVRAPDSLNTSREVTVNVGGVEDTFTVTTRDSIIGFNTPAGNLGTFQVTGQVVASISVDPTGHGWGLQGGQPSNFPGNLQLSPSGSNLDIVCYNAAACVGTYTFEASIKTHHPVETASRTFSITIEQ